MNFLQINGNKNNFCNTEIQNFKGFSKNTLLESGCIPIEEIAELALREGHSTNPLYSVHRWFARRLGSQFRSILTGLSLEENEAEKFWDTYLGDVPLNGALVLDPFMGGGTSLVEALRCNTKVIGYDIDPVATLISRFELEAANYDENIYSKIDETCSPITNKISYFHKTNVKDVGEREVLHHFWVERRVCPSCGNKFEIHPHFQLAYNKDKGIQWVFCKKCYEIYELPIESKIINCKCGEKTVIKKGTLINRKVVCPYCNESQTLSNRVEKTLKRPEWHLFAQEYIERTSSGVTRHFKPATEDDWTLFNKASQILREIEEKERFAPTRPIPTFGRSDQRPLIHGFCKYSDLFNDRQLLHLTLLGKKVIDLKDQELKTILSLAFSEHLTTNCMYAAYAFGYRRVSPMFSIHSFRHITRPVEINPWLKRIGRGTFPNCVDKIIKAIEFSKAPTGLDPRGGRYSITGSRIYSTYSTKNPEYVINGLSHAALITQTSERLSAVPNESVDLILTDPPYFNNLSYSELSDFYLAWHQSLGIAETPYDDLTVSAPISENLAVKKISEKAINDYRHKLTDVFSECYRVLKNEGIFVFTYHHKSTEAWYSVGESLVKSGFICSSVIPLRGEGQGGLHSQNGTIKWDAVLICRKDMSIAINKKKIGNVLISLKSAENAKQKANTFFKRLNINKKIGFHEPDRLNLERAFIVATSFIGYNKKSTIPLSLALENTKNKVAPEN